MKKYDSLAEITLEKSALTIGAFAGLHRGHQRLIQMAVLGGGMWKLPTVAITFDPAPGVYFGQLDGASRIMTNAERIEFFEWLGVEHLVILPFTEEIARKSAQAFLAELTNAIHPQQFWVGKDFSLGRNGEGSVSWLQLNQEKFGFRLNVMDDLIVDGAKVSSSGIRDLLFKGEIERANQMLGHPFSISGPVISGDGRGRRLGFPTINMPYPAEKQPIPYGVYACWLTADGGATLPAVTNVGVRPTFHTEKRVVVESYLLKGGDQLSVQNATLEFVSFFRPETRFDSAQQLIEQVQLDAQKAEKLLI